MKWNIKTNNYVKLNDKITKYNRLDREDILNNLTLRNIHKLFFFIKKGIFSDYHILKQNNKYVKLNELIYKIII